MAAGDGNDSDGRGFEGSDGERTDAPNGAGDDAMMGLSYPFAMVISDPRLPDNPIIYVNKAFERITQYTADYAIGRNCRFLQGEQTDREDVRRIREGIEKGEDVSVDILNYRADGTSFTNRLLVAPLYDGDGKIVNFLGIQRTLGEQDATGEAARRDDPVEQGLRAQVREDRSEASDTIMDADPLRAIRNGVQDHLALVMNLARLDEDGEREGTPRALGRRIESLQLLYEELDEAGVASVRDQTIPLGAYLSRVAATLNHLEGRRSIRMNVDCDQLEVPTPIAARLGLLASELILNALRHAFVERRDGLVNVEFKLLSYGRARLTVKDDGLGMGDEEDWPYRQDEGAEDAEERRTGMRVGAKLVRRLLDALDAALEVRTGSFGTTIEIGLDIGSSMTADHRLRRSSLRQT